MVFLRKYDLWSKLFYFTLIGTYGMLLGANENGKWEFFIEKTWKKLDTNDFSIECIARKGIN